MGLRSLSLYALYQVGLKSGHYQRMTQDKGQELALDPRSFVLHPLFDLRPREKLLAILGHDGKASLLQEAGEILNGKFRMFGGGPVELKLKGDWPLAHWTEYETGRIKLDGDLKFIWEPARFGWAFTLGRAYQTTREPKYAEAFWTYFEAFNQANPANLGPHWMNCQELAIRLLALVWAAQVFGTAPSSSPARGERLAHSIAEHAQRIPPTLVYARSQNNNHLVTEAAALFTANHSPPDHPQSPRWRTLGWTWLNRALREQIGSYGEYIQHSANYHRLMLQAVLWVDAIIRTAGRSHGYQLLWPAQTLEALTRASHWLFSMIDSASGRTPNLGANDGALILPLSATPFNDFRPTAQTAARAFLRNGLPAGAPDRKLETERGRQGPGHGSRDRRDDVTSAWNRLDQPLVLQQGEPFPNRRLAHAKSLRELFLVQHRAGLELPRQDRVAQEADSLAPERITSVALEPLDRIPHCLPSVDRSCPHGWPE